MTTASTSVGNVLLVVTVIALVAPVWIFSLQDIVRRPDLTDSWKAWWCLAVVLFPILGTLAYLVYLNVRPPRATPEKDRELELLSDLHDRGTLTDHEFAAEKERVTAGSGARSDR